ncbi:MAG: dephospho-CoA kinase [Anaerolineales bacterium]|jgi:dephospho-CoA kinase|nr:dephospho-CoA kinase [Anaerolineales bacterium]
MSAWPGKFVIGLTGNIATGKSEVRKMLEKLGAVGIDADSLAHQVMKSQQPAFPTILGAFGQKILGEDGEIDRQRLGQIVFADPVALAQLEAIVHPEVRKKVDQIIRNAPQQVIVIEAIKLLEAGYPASCDSIWTTWSSPAVQLSRLVSQRGMSEALANQRIAVQPPQEQKIAAADVVIPNNRGLEELWQQVLENWNKLFRSNEVPADLWS